MPSRVPARVVAVAMALTFSPALCAADESEDADFDRDVAPLLRRDCVGCHQPARAKGGVDFTSYAALMAGDRSGDALVVPGDPDASPLLDSVTPHEDQPPDMPKDAEPLSEAELALLRRWIQAGAPGPSEALRPLVDAEHPPRYLRPPVVPGLDWSPDGRFVAVAGFHEALLYDAEGTLHARLIGLSERIESLAFSPDGEQLAVVGGSPGRFGELQVWSIDPPRLQLSRSIGHDVLFGASWSPDGLSIAFGSTDTSVRVLDAESGEELLYQGAHEDWVLDTCFSTDGSHLITVSRDRSMKLIHVPEQQFIDNITSITPGALKGGLQSVDRHPQLDQLLIGGADGVPKIFRMYREKKRRIGDDFNLIQALPAMDGRVFDAEYSPDGMLVAAAASTGPAGEVVLSEVEGGKERWRVPWPCGAYALSFDPEGRRLAVAGFDGILRIYDTADGRAITEFAVLPPAAPPTDRGSAALDGTRPTSTPER